MLSPRIKEEAKAARIAVDPGFVQIDNVDLRYDEGDGAQALMSWRAVLWPHHVMRRCDVTLIDVDVSRGDPLPAAAGAASADNLDARAFRLRSRRVGDKPAVMAAPQVRL